MRRLIFVLCLLPLTAAAAPATVVYRRPTDSRPAFAAGELSPPSALAPEAAARAFFAGVPALAPVPAAALDQATVRRLGVGSIVRFTLSHAGLPIVDTDVAVRLDGRGRVRAVAGRPLRLETAGPATPTLTARAAQELLATTHVPQRAAAVRLATPRLVWLAAGDGTLRLAWELRLPVVPAFAEALLFRVDARSGALLTARNLVRFADQGQVFVVDPTTDGNQTSVVPLADLGPEASDPPDALFNSLIKILNCVDRHSTVPVNFGGYNANVHVCDEVPTVTRDGSGDYVQYDPVTTALTPVANATEDAAACLTNPGCDPFAEVNAYWHVMKAYRYFQGFNDPAFAELITKPLQVNVNFRFPIDMQSGGFDPINAMDANGKLFGWDNSMFMPSGQLIPGLNRPAAVMLFEGSHHDISYDSTVTYHEFTHAVTWTLGSIQSQFALDEQGLDYAPPSLGEAFSDVFAAFLSEQDVVAGYAFDWDPTAQRHLREWHDVCPDFLTGEEHLDSVGISEALWKIHDTLGADSEPAIFAALAGLARDANFAETAAAVESALGDTLGAAAQETAHAVFVDHNVADCRRVIPYEAPRDLLLTYGSAETGLLPTPGILQFKYTAATRISNLKLSFQWSPGMSSMFASGTTSYKVIVRQGEPITWSYDGTDPTATQDYEFALSTPSSGAPTAEGSLPDVLPPGDYYLMIVSTGDLGGVAQAITITADALPQDDAGPPEDGGVDAGDGGDDGGRGCGCRTAPPAGGGALALLGLALLLVRRR
jgi:MYXO-CTERM domain-containing protein